MSSPRPMNCRTTPRKIANAHASSPVSGLSLSALGVDAMAAEGAFEHVQLIAQQRYLGADVMRQRIPREQGKAVEHPTPAPIVYKERLHTIGDNFSGNRHPQSPTPALVALNHFDTGNGLLKMRDLDVRLGRVLAPIGQPPLPDTFKQTRFGQCEVAHIVTFAFL